MEDKVPKALEIEIIKLDQLLRDTEWSPNRRKYLESKLSLYKKFSNEINSLSY